MIFRNLTSDGDWTFGNGVADYLVGEDAIKMNIQTRLKCFLNDWFADMSFGIDWWNLLGQKGSSAEANVLLQCRTSISGAYGVVKINSVMTSLDRTTRQLTLTFDVDSIYADNLTGGVTI